MFVGSCSGCIQVPTPVYYWTPYPTIAAKKYPYNIAELLQATQSFSAKSPQTGENLSTRNGHLYYSTNKSENDSRRSDEYAHHARKRTSGHEIHAKDQSSPKDDFAGEVLNFSKKVEKAKCSLPSALEPLQALCSSGPRGYGSLSPSGQYSCSPTRTTTTATTTSKTLKFGISRILGEDFGKDKRDTENETHHSSSHRGGQSKRPCECTYEGCAMYPQLRFPSHALTAVHALQPPKYPPASGSDVLPGPYSILNTDVTIGPHSKRKRSWSRAVFSNLQRKGLEKRFEVQKYVTKPDRRQLAAMLGLTDAQVKVWFQNRRMKWRHAQQQGSEADNNTIVSKDDENDNTSGNGVGYTGNDVDDSGHESENELQIDDSMVALSEDDDEEGVNGTDIHNEDIREMDINISDTSEAPENPTDTDKHTPFEQS